MLGEWLVANKELIITLLGGLVIYLGTFIYNRIGDTRLKKMLGAVDVYSQNITGSNASLGVVVEEINRSLHKVETLGSEVEKLLETQKSLTENIKKQDKLIKELSKQLEITTGIIRATNNKSED